MSDIKEKISEEIESIDFESIDYAIELRTSEGNIRLDLFPKKAPGHCKNMIALAKVGFYDGLIFHRVIPGFMIQGGCPEGTGMGGPGYRLDAEFNDCPHVPGTLSMARAQDPNSAGSQFFICLEKVPHLDRQYTVFGQTSDSQSLEVVKKIGVCATGAQDRPQTDITILKATVIEQSV